MIIGRCPADVHCKLDILEATGSDDIFHYLSKNEEYTEYKQTDEEKLKEYVRRLAVAKAKDEENGLAEGAKGDFSKILLEAQAWGGASMPGLIIFFYLLMASSFSWICKCVALTL